MTTINEKIILEVNALFKLGGWVQLPIGSIIKTTYAPLEYLHKNVCWIVLEHASNPEAFLIVDKAWFDGPNPISKARIPPNCFSWITPTGNEKVVEVIALPKDLPDLKLWLHKVT